MFPIGCNLARCAVLTTMPHGTRWLLVERPLVGNLFHSAFQVLGFLLSATILVNFFLSVWWGPPLRYSLRLKNITEGEKYQNFSNEEIIEELQEQ